MPEFLTFLLNKNQCLSHKHHGTQLLDLQESYQVLDVQAQEWILLFRFLPCHEYAFLGL